jgi:DNA gyrase subunit A
MINLLQLMPGEKVAEIIKFSADIPGNLVMVTRKGTIKKTNSDEYKHVNKNGKIAITLLDDDKLISVQETTGRDEIILASHKGRSLRFSEEKLRRLGRKSRGVKSMRLDSDDYVVDMCVLKPDTKILTITENGYGKRTNADEYKIQQSRMGKGIKAGTFNEKTGNLVCLKQVKEDQDIILMTDIGTIIRFKASEVSVIGRLSQGVKIMRMKDNKGKIVCTSVTEHEDEDENEEIYQENDEVKQEEVAENDE